MKLLITLVCTLAIITLGAQATQPESGETKPAQTQEQEDSFVYVVMNTSKGAIYIALNETKAPVSVENFLRYTDEGFYDNTVFHRVMDGFMIQGGGFDKDMKKKDTHDPIENEWKNGLSNTRGTLAMARLGGRANSATSQFFINHADNGFLDQPRDGSGYAVFGRVVKGMDVIDTIAKVRTKVVGMHQHYPVEPIMIESVERLSDEQIEELGLAEAAG